jgi:hypothetical protein
LWGRWVCNHPQEDLAKFDYMSKFRNDTMVWQHCNLLSKYGNLKKCGENGLKFSQKEPFSLTQHLFFGVAKLLKLVFME